MNLSWDSATVSNGSHIISVVAYDAAGNSSQSTVGVNVANPSSTPQPPAPTPTGTPPYFINFNIGPVSGLQVPVTASVDCGGVTCPTFTYDWDWGDGTHGPGTTESEIHTYASGGSKSITLTVLLNGSSVGSTTRSVTLTNPDLPPTVDGTCTPSPNTWQMQVVDASTDDGPDGDALPGDGNSTLKIVIDWGDGSTKTITTRGATANHTYLTKAPLGTYTVTQSAIDSKLQKVSRTCVATVASFQITGLVVKQKNEHATAGGLGLREAHEGLDDRQVHVHTGERKLRVCGSQAGCLCGRRDEDQVHVPGDADHRGPGQPPQRAPGQQRHHRDQTVMSASGEQMSEMRITKGYVERNRFAVAGGG